MTHTHKSSCGVQAGPRQKLQIARGANPFRNKVQIPFGTRCKSLIPFGIRYKYRSDSRGARGGTRRGRQPGRPVVRQPLRQLLKAATQEQQGDQPLLAPSSIYYDIMLYYIIFHDMT